MIDSIKLKWFYGISLGFILIGCVCLMKEFYWLAVLPVALTILYLAVFKIDTLLLIVAFTTPLAVNLRDTQFGVALSVPTEPLMFGILLLFIFKIVFEGGFDRRVLFHPVTIVIIINLIWLFITCLTSSMIVVSFKHYLARL